MELSHTALIKMGSTCHKVINYTIYMNMQAPYQDCGLETLRAQLGSQPDTLDP
jgi:hypothetical protein